MPRTSSPLLTFAFDIGHSSIGWAALQNPEIVGAEPDILGCGTVVFQSADCQNQQRAGFRRQRRHIASTRNRIRRLGAFLVHLGALSADELREKHRAGGGHSFPWLLAARVLNGQQILSWSEIWDVLRWYAHNRGYDGNALWAKNQVEEDDSRKEDTKKEENARRLMREYGTDTMAETVCAFLGLDPSTDQNPAPLRYFKGNQAAFPRNVVVKEVRLILSTHLGQLKELNENVITSLLEDWTVARDCIAAPIRLPERYRGGLLFGQMVPRFDNRIIPQCRISGKQTPIRHCREFYYYRWGMLLNNLRKVDPITGQSISLSAQERAKLHEKMEELGYLTKTSLDKALREDVGVEPANLDTMFLTPEMEKALVLNPVKRELNTSGLKEIWDCIPTRWQKVFAGEIYKGRKRNGRFPTLGLWRQRMLEDGVDVSSFDVVLQKSLSKQSKKKTAPSIESILNKEIRLSPQNKADGRSPYSRRLMQQAWRDVLNGLDPRGLRENGTYGCLAETPEIVEKQWKCNIDKQTNNHLVRHRLLIFQRLLSDLTRRYANGRPEVVDKVVIEVIRDLREFAGMTVKEKAKLLGIKLADHKKAVEYLEEKRKETGQDFLITAGLIKKVRIAFDMKWTCPYTGRSYCLQDILEGRVDREHIIPYSLRPSDSLESLVLTFSDINRWKGQRTAIRFIEETEDDHRTLSLSAYKEKLEGLLMRGGSKDDENRRRKRKELLLVRDYNQREGEFTGRDLTQTSQLNKLAAYQTLACFSESSFQPHQVVHMAGSVTSAVRRAWRIEGCLGRANPGVWGEDGKVRPKGEIRDITHLHHALDAISLALASWYFPKNGRLWTLLSKRRLTEAERCELSDLARIPIPFDSTGKFSLPDLSNALKEQIGVRLAEKRVVMHIPKTYRGLKVQQNTWRVLGVDKDCPSKMKLTQAMRDSDSGKRVRDYDSKRATKLLGLREGKLSQLKGVLVIDGNYGVALAAEPEVIPHISVHQRLNELKVSNDGVAPKLLRNGDKIEVSSGVFKGVWRIHSIKDAAAGLLLDIGSPDIPRVANKTPGCKINVLLKSLLKSGMRVISSDYTGSET
jgi:transcriptional regulator with XRE-family HTH domain